MKAKELREKNLEELNKMLKELKLSQIRAFSEWGKEKVSRKEAGIETKEGKPGQKTSLQRDIRRNIAKILTVMREKNENKHNL